MPPVPACPAFRQLPDQPWWGFYSVTSSAFPRPLNGCAGISFRATCPESFLSQRSHTRNKDCSGQHWFFFIIIIIISRLRGRSLFRVLFFEHFTLAHLVLRVSACRTDSGSAEGTQSEREKSTEFPMTVGLKSAQPGAACCSLCSQTC